jgi:hypothetical protein
VQIHISRECQSFETAPKTASILSRRRPLAVARVEQPAFQMTYQYAHTNFFARFFTRVCAQTASGKSLKKSHPNAEG